MSPDLRFSLAPIVLVLCLATGPASAQHGTTGGEWRTWAGDLGATRYAPLDQIDADNFADLEVAWRFNTDNFGPGPDFNLQSTPLMADGVLYQRPAAGGASSQSTRGPASCSGCIASTRGSARRAPCGGGLVGGSVTGPTAPVTSGSTSSPSAISSWRSTPGRATPSRTSATTVSSILSSITTRILTPPPSWPGGEHRSWPRTLS